MQNVVGPTLVAMATKFGLGAEIQSPTGLSFSYFIFHCTYYFRIGRRPTNCNCNDSVIRDFNRNLKSRTSVSGFARLQWLYTATLRSEK